MFAASTIKTIAERRWLDGLYPLFPGLYRVATQYFPRYDKENQDAAQEVYVKLAARPVFFRRKLNRRRPRFKSCLAAMARTASLDLPRRRKRLANYLPLEDPEPEVDTSLGPRSGCHLGGHRHGKAAPRPGSDPDSAPGQLALLPENEPNSVYRHQRGAARANF